MTLGWFSRKQIINTFKLNVLNIELMLSQVEVESFFFFKLWSYFLLLLLPFIPLSRYQGFKVSVDHRREQTTQDRTWTKDSETQKLSPYIPWNNPTA